MTIKQRIIGKSLGTALLVAAVGVLSAVSMLHIGSTLRMIVVAELHESSEADQLQGAASTIDELIDKYIAAVQNHQPTDPVRLVADVDVAFDKIAQATSRLDRAIQFQPADAARRGSAHGVLWNDRPQLKLIEDQAEISHDEWSKLRSEMKSGEITNSAALDKLTLATDGLLRDSQDFESGAKADMMRGLGVAQDQVTASVRIFIVAAVLAVVLSLGAGMLLAIPLVSRLARLRDGAMEIGKGNLEARINIINSDEIGQLATAFNEMAAGLRRSRVEIRENELQFRELAETIHEIFWVSDPASTKILYISPAYEEVWGLTCQSIYDNLLSFAEAIVPEERSRVVAALAKAATGGFDQEYRIIRPDGTMRWIHARGFPVYGETGQVERIVGIASDITKQRLAEDALRRASAELEQRVEMRTAELQQANEAMLKKEADLKRAKDIAEAASRAKSVVFDTALDAIVTINSSGIITDWNLQAETMFGWHRTEVIGKRIDHTIIRGSHWDAHRRAIEAFLKAGEGPLLNSLAEIIALRRDGQEFPVEIAVTPAWLDGECSFTAFIRDITPRKQTEADLREAKDAAETANRTKSDFLAKMSHEIRTPLNGVIGMSGLLLDTTLDEKQQRIAELIKSSGASLAELIDDLLDFSKIEARKLELKSIDFDLYLAVEEVTEIMSIKASQKGLELTCLTMPEVPRQVKGDSQRLKQILINLVNNAIKFTETGSVSTRLTVDEKSSEHVIVRFSITDTGIGIPANRMDRLFKSFSQVDSSTTRSYGGSGLGLAISKQLAELMRGSIGVESVVGKGSTFWFTARLSLSPLRPSFGISPRGLRVLALHGSPTAREILRSQLSGWGLEATTCSSGDEAMKVLVDAEAKGRPYDVAILDGELADTNTLELGKAIKASKDIGSTVLLILLPLNNEFEPLALRAAGFAGHLVKPVRQSRLYDTIVDAIALASQPEKLVAPNPSAAIDSSSRSAAAMQQARILIVEDNRVNQIVATEVLAVYGYASDIAENGKKAVTAAATGKYDLILMDCLMPEMDGFEATSRIRQAEATDAKNPHRHTPIIALTANAINGDRTRCLEVGMDDYVSKPIDAKRLVDAIQTLLAKSAETSPVPSALAAPAPTTASEDTPPLAIEALLERCMGSIETATSILDEFERQAVADLGEIKRHVLSGDCEATARVAHALKGASGILSADALAGIALKLEKMGRSGVISDQDQLLSQLNREVRRCIDYLPIARSAITKKVEV